MFISIVLFLYIYAIKFNAFPIAVDKLVFLLSLVYIVLHFKAFYKFLLFNLDLLKYYILILLLFTYSGLIFSLNVSYDTDLLYSLFLRLTIFYIPIVTILFYLRMNFIQKDFLLFIFKLLVFIITLQSFLILYSFVNFEFKSQIDEILPFLGNIDETRLDRMRGFSNSSGATLSLVQGTGAFIALFLLDKTSSNPNKVLYTLIIIINVLAIIFVARTGLLLFIFSSFIYLLLNFSFKSIKNIFLIIVGTIVLFYVVLNFGIFIDEKYLELFYNKILPWAFELFINIASSNDATTGSSEHLWSMIHFPDNIKTFLFGDGIYERPYTLSDSGYVRYIYSIGFVGVLLLLFPIMYLMYKLKNFKYIKRKDYIWLFSLVLYIILIDIKEPFLLKPQSYPLVLILIFSYTIQFNMNKKEYR